MTSCEASCDYKVTPLRLVNGNLGILYLALVLCCVVIYFYVGTKPILTFDRTLYTLRHGYSGSQPLPEVATTATVSTNTMTLLLMLTMLFTTNMIFHFGYSLDWKRAYTVMLMERTNKLRWIQFAIVNTLISLIVAQMCGTCSFDFFLSALFFLPITGALGYFMEKSNPCFPGLFWLAYIAFIAILIGAYWTPIITNLTIHYLDSRGSLASYIYFAAGALMFFHLIIIFMTYIQTRTRLHYSTVDLANSGLMFILSAAMLGILTWSILCSP